MKLPSAYQEIISPYIATARGFLESGEKLSAIAFVGNFSTKEMVQVTLDFHDDASKNSSTLAIQMSAKSIDADFIFIAMEAWGLKKKYVPRYKEILEEFGSIGNCPYREDIISFSLETANGIWSGTAPIRPKPPSKKRRTFGELTFIFADGVEGRFAGLLPLKNDVTSAIH